MAEFMRVNRSIWKFDLAVDDVVRIQLPIGARVLTVATQYGLPKIWALVDPAAETEERVFAVHGTGHSVFAGVEVEGSYLGSFQMFGGDFVGHVFELTKFRSHTIKGER